MKRRLLVVLLLLLSAAPVFAQFKREAFQQSYNDDKATSKDSVDVLFSLKEYFGGLKHESEIKIGTMFAGSLVFVGSIRRASTMQPSTVSSARASRTGEP